MKMTTDKATSFRHSGLVSKSGLVWWAIILSVGAGFLAFTTEQNLPVLLPMLAVISSSMFFLWTLWYRRGIIPFFEIGTVYVAVVSLYAFYPLLAYNVNGLSYTPTNDNRLFQAQPGPQEVGAIGWYYVAHLAAFIAVYLLVRGRLPLATPFPRRPDKFILPIALIFYALITGFFLFLGLYYDLSANNYGASYLIHLRLPLVLAQLSNHLGGIRLTLALVILAVLFLNYQKYRLLIAAWLLLITGLTFFRLGSRTELVLFIAAAAMMYHFLVKPISFWIMILVGTSGLVIFSLLGILRGGESVSELYSGSNFFAYNAEFDGLFGNAFDLNRLRARGMVGDLPPAFYLADFLALIPQQFIPLTKISPSDWYVNTFYPDYAATGGGLAFGTIAESIVGLGWIDLIGRGAVLGLILAQVHRYYVTHHTSFWTFIFYIWITLLVYQLFRSTTFSLLGLFFYRFLPVWIAVKLLSAILRGATSKNLASLPCG